MVHKQTEVRLREMFNSSYKLITALPAWSAWEYSSEIGQEIDDIIFARYKDILIDSERYLVTLNSWLASHLIDLTRMYEALTEEYKPLENYNMIENEESGRDIKDTDSDGYISKEGTRVSASKRYGTERSSQTVPDTKSSRYTTTYDQAADGRLEAYTSEEIQNAPTIEGHNAQITITEQQPDANQRQGSEITESYSGSITIPHGQGSLTGDRGEQREHSHTGSDDLTRELTRHGNIGVTTSQQMLISEIDLRIKYSFINIFCDMFSREMTIGVWKL